MALLKKINYLWASARGIKIPNSKHQIPKKIFSEKFVGVVSKHLSKTNVASLGELNPKRLNSVCRTGRLDERVKASTLMETLVATVLIVIIFMIASMTMNKLLNRNIKQNTELAEERLHALEYQYKNKGLKLPYYEDFESWEISISAIHTGATNLVSLEAENTHSKTVVTNYINSEESEE